MNKYIFCFLTIMTISNLVARAQYLNDIQGKPYMEQSYTEVEGSPYLIANWATGAVKLVNGKSITAKLKYDLIKDELLFQNKRDSVALSFVDPVQYFSFNDVAIDESNIAPLVFGSGYPPVDNQTQASFYQVIADGKVKLLKHYKKTIRVDKAFNSATSTQTFVLADVYYVFINNQITRIKPSQKSILAALGDKADQLQGYMKSNTVNYKSDVALAKLFSYYNSL
jgi:hypothetical protein